MFVKNLAISRFMLHGTGKRQPMLLEQLTTIKTTRERHWPENNLPLNPPVIKIGPERPRRNKKKAAHEDPKRLEKLSRVGRKM